MPEFLFAPTPHNEAIDFIKSKPAVPREIFDKLLPELQARAFTITGVEPANVLQSIRDMVADLPAGMPFEKQKALITEALAPWLDEEAAAARAELLLRINGQEAYATAAYRVMDAQRGVFKSWQYQTMGDSHVRPTHRALDGIVLPASSPFWNDHYPPWDWGCRCIVIPLSGAGVDHIRKQDAGKPPEQQRVIEGPLLRELEQNNRLVRGMNEITNVSPPQREGASAFHYHPGDMVLSVDDLRARYSPQVWSTFEKWARATEIPQESRTVWEWISGEPGAPFVAKTEPYLKTIAQGTPVSAAVDLQTLKRQQAMVQEVIDAIDAVHGDGPLDRIPFDNRVLRKSTGSYWSNPQRAVSIGITRAKELTPGDLKVSIAHEIGHWLDHIGVQSVSKFASEDAGGAAAEIRNAIVNSEAYQQILKSPASSYRTYILQGREAFARAYSQFIAEESGNADMLAQLELIRKGATNFWSSSQWSTDDFSPIRAAFRKLFRSLGWIQ